MMLARLKRYNRTNTHSGLCNNSIFEYSPEVTWEFTLSSDILHDTQFKEANEGKDLEGSSDGDSEGGIPSVSKIRELGSVVADLSGKVDSGSVDEVSNNSKHADTSVLDLDVTERSNFSWSPSATRPRGSKNPRGGWAPSSSSKAMLVATEVRAACFAGAKAAAEAIREARMAVFILESV